MTNTPIPSSVTAARALVTSSNYYSLGYLALCWATYYADTNASSVISAIDSQYTDAGYWQLDWGPASSAAHLVLCASYRDQSSKLPIFEAIAIRGTEPSTSFLGILGQLQNDLDGGCQVSWPASNGCVDPSESSGSTPLVAQGTYDGMNELLSLQSTADGTTLLQFLGTFVPANEGVPLVVTGHSLGGALTSVVAMNLASQSACAGATIVPVTFAAPTAGNQAFVDLYMKTFPPWQRWYNTWDMVPMAFDAIENMYNCWGNGVYTNNPIEFPHCTCPCGANAADAIKDLKNVIGSLQYVHETGSGAYALTGQCLATTSSSTTSSADENWYSELLLQHLPACGYWPLMTKQYASSLGAVSYPSWAPAAACTGA